MKDYLKLMRIEHYIKNFIIFLPLFFSRNLFNVNMLIASLIGFVQFSFVSSIVYIINDIKDIDNDRKHLIKCKRPITSGKISKKNAIVLAIILFIIVVLLNIYLFTINVNYSFLMLILYLILNIMYSFGLKEKPIIDIAILSSGFILRLFFGGLLTSIPISNYLFLSIMCGSIFMAIGKRRNELRNNGNKSRKVLTYYNDIFLSLNFYLYLALTLVFFSFWAMSLNNSYVIYIIPLVYMIFLRYSLDIEKEGSFGDPVEVFFSDIFLIICAILSLISLFIVLYVI